MQASNNSWEAIIYEKNWNFYKKTLEPNYENIWDYVVITASNKEQEKEYLNEIEYRQNNNLLPQKTKFIVATDFKEKRIGSGGATLNALLSIKEKNFNDLKILIINSGGDCKRIPQYSTTGKIFMPIQRILPDGRSSSLFDELFIAFSTVPSKMKPGVLILSGDVLLTFDYSEVNLEETAMALSVKTESKIGENHGVFLTDENNNLIKFLHKQNKKTLKENRSN